MYWRTCEIDADRMIWFRAEDEISFIISYDAARPNDGFRASYAEPGCDPVFLNGGFDDFKSASTALRAAFSIGGGL